MAPAAERQTARGPGATKHRSTGMKATFDHFHRSLACRHRGSSFIQRGRQSLSHGHPRPSLTTGHRHKGVASVSEAASWITAAMRARGMCDFKVEQEEGLSPPLLCCCKVQACFLFANRSLFASHYSTLPDLLKKLICCNPGYRSHLLTGTPLFWAVPLCEPGVRRHGWSFADCLIIE